ncbi:MULTISPECIES: SCO2584 family spore wall biosynthesis protein [unclassified Streptomyces]|uniref:SCO2584 family spore wall biosynthesis protein n=1 Tax=Streptomyces sp. NPDC055082 TaxID=3365718 RepID=UPI0037D49975
MPDDVGGRPFPDGWEPDDDRGGADEDFAAVVFDEDFVRAAAVHEPTAVERLLAAAQARAEADAARARRGGPMDDDLYEDFGRDGAYGRERAYGDPLDPDDDDAAGTGPYGRHGGSLRPYRGAARWHRPVAWLLALVMGVGMVALAFTAVYRGGSASRGEQAPPPVTSGVDKPGSDQPSTDRSGSDTRGFDRPGAAPSASADYSRPAVSAVPRTP